MLRLNRLTVLAHMEATDLAPSKWAREAGISDRTAYRIVQHEGNAVPASFKSVTRIAKYLGCKREDICVDSLPQ